MTTTTGRWISLRSDLYFANVCPFRRGTLASNMIA